jgi:hypothetical protein
MLRCWAGARFCAEGLLDIQEAVDERQTPAERAGLIDELGQDEIQRLIAVEFER